MIEYIGLPALVSLAVWFLLLAILKHRHSGLPYRICFAFFGLYMMLLIGLTLFPIPRADPYTAPLQPVDMLALTRSNFIPFFFGPFATVESIVYAIKWNIVLTLPFGFCICFITRIRWRDLLWLPLTVGVVIESCQFLVSLLVGIPYRVIDINDVIFNAVGVMGGYLLFRLLAAVYLLFTRKSRFKPGGMADYLQTIAGR